MTGVPLLFISGEYPPDVGGVGDYTARLRAALEDQGWSSRVVTRRDVGRWNARGLVRTLQAVTPTGLVHIQYQAGAFDLLGDICLLPVLLRAIRPRVRVVTTFHDTRIPYLFPKAGRLRPASVRSLARTSHAVIAADAADLRWLSPGDRSSPWSVQIPIGSNVPCAPPAGYHRAAFRDRLGAASDGTPIVAYFGLLNASKGLDLLVDAFSRVRAHLPDARLLLLGGDVGASDPTDRATAVRLQTRLAPLGTAVVRTGWLPPHDLSAHLLAADIALLPYADGASARRGSLLAFAEHGVAIVTTVPARPEVADAVVAVPSTPVALADAVLALWRDPTARAAQHAASLRLAARVAWPEIARQHLRLYERLLERATPR